MNGKLVFVVLAALFAYCNGHLYCSHEIGINYPGNDIKKLDTPTNEECQKTCYEMTECKGYSYLTTAKVCLLKTVVNNQTREERRGYISGRCTPCTMKDNVDYPGNDIHRHFVESLLTCTDTCLRTEYCVGYVYDKITGSCWVKRSTPREVEYEPMKNGHVLSSGKCEVQHSDSAGIFGF